MRIKQAPTVAEAEGQLPYPLNLGPSVRIYAPQHWAQHQRHEPPVDSEAWMAGALAARRTYGEFFTRWATDHGHDIGDAMAAKVNRRPFWD